MEVYAVTCIRLKRTFVGAMIENKHSDADPLKCISCIDDTVLTPLKTVQNYRRVNM